MTLIVGLGHQSGVGKNTVAHIISQQMPILAGKVRLAQAAFAAGVKKTAHQLFSPYGLRDGHHYELHREDRLVPLPVINKTPIELWVGVGDSMRTLAKNVWIEQAFREVEPCHIGLITDLRYRNEADAIRARCGIVVKVENPRVTPLNTPADHDMDEFNDWDFTVVNDGTIEQLRFKVSALTELILDAVTC